VSAAVLLGHVGSPRFELGLECGELLVDRAFDAELFELAVDVALTWSAPE
jgi:hypothetical protein